MDIETAQTAGAAAPRSGGWRWAARQAGQFVLAGVFVALAVYGARWMIETKPSAPRQAVAEPVFTVETTRVAVERISPEIRIFGSIAARRAVELRALVQGAVVEVHPQLVVGERVPEGAELVRIDPFAFEGAVVEAQADLEETRARLAEAEAQVTSSNLDLARAEEQLVLAERDVVRARELAARGAGNERVLDERRLTVSQRAQAVETQRSQIRIQQARVAQQRAALQRLEWRLAQARRNLADTVLRAPFDGVVRSEFVEPGRRLGVNDVVAELYEESALDVAFTVPDAEFGRLMEGDAPLIGKTVDVVWRVGDAPVRARAVIDRIGADVRAERGGVELIARLVDVAGGRELKPGAFVTVTMPGRAFDAALRAPETALYNGDHVFVVVDGALSRRAVEVLAWEGAVVILRGAGDAEARAALDGAEILTTRLAEAGEGVRVRRSSEPLSEPTAAGEAAAHAAIAE